MELYEEGRHEHVTTYTTMWKEHHLVKTTESGEIYSWNVHHSIPVSVTRNVDPRGMLKELVMSSIAAIGYVMLKQKTDRRTAKFDELCHQLISCFPSKGDD